MKNGFKKYAWISFGAVFGAIAITGAAFYFLAGDIASRSSAIAADRTAIAQQDNSLAAFTEVKGDAVQAAAYQTAMDELLPTSNGLIDFPQWLKNFAATYNVTDNFAFGDIITVITRYVPGEIGFSLTAQGSEIGVFSFLENLESKAPGFLLEFDSVNFTENGSSSKAVIGGKMFFK